MAGPVGACPASMPRSPAVYNRGMADGESGRYHRLQLWLRLARLVLGAGYLVALLITGAGPLLAVFAARLTESAPLHVAVVAVALGAGQALLGAPPARVSSWVPPRRSRLLPQSLSWLLA